MAEVTLEFLGQQLAELLAEVRLMRETLAEMRSEMDGQFDLMMSRGAKADGLEKVVAGLGRRVTALERR